MAILSTFFLPGILVLFDVGGNEGQTIASFEKKFPYSVIHSFEPASSSFEKLKKAGRHDTTSVWNMALGSKPGRQVFQENAMSEMSSFLPLGERGWGKVDKEILVDVTTVDQFCADIRSNELMS